MSDGVWVSLSEAATQRGVSKQAISKRLKHLGGRVSTRREGQRLLLNIAEYDRMVGDDTDPAQELRNRGLGLSSEAAAPAADRPENLAARVFSTQRAKREGYVAELSRIDFEERTGKLLKVQDVEDAMVRCATAILRIIDQLPGKSEHPEVRAILKREALELRRTIAAEFTLLAAQAPEDGLT